MGFLKFVGASEKGNQGNHLCKTARKAAPLLGLGQMQKGNLGVTSR
jgi:hypothetical protein